MNETRREELESIHNAIEELSQRLGMVLEEEEEYYDDIPEDYQDTEECEKIQDIIYALCTAADGLENASFSVVAAMG